MNSKSVAQAPEIELTSTGIAIVIPSKAIMRIKGNPIEITFKEGADRVIKPSARLIIKIDNKIGNAIASPPVNISPVTFSRAS